MRKPEESMADQKVATLSEEVLVRAATIIRNGGIVAFPTETYYGLAVDPESPEAVAKLFAIKKRRDDKPILLLVENKAQLCHLTGHIPTAYLPLIDRYWPGALTLIFQAHQSLLPGLTAGSGTIGARVSSHPIAGALVRHVGRPITATSANVSGEKPAVNAEEVREIFGSNVDFILDGGQTSGGLASTILSFQYGKLVLIRTGRVVLNLEELNRSLTSG